MDPKSLESIENILTTFEATSSEMRKTLRLIASLKYNKPNVAQSTDWVDCPRKQPALARLRKKLQLPIASEKEMHDFGRRLKDRDYKKDYTKLMYHCWRNFKEIPETVREIMNETCSGKLWKIYTLHGTARKMPFKNTQVFKSISEYIRSKFSGKKGKITKEIEFGVKKWMLKQTVTFAMSEKSKLGESLILPPAKRLGEAVAVERSKDTSNSTLDAISKQTYANDPANQFSLITANHLPSQTSDSENVAFLITTNNLASDTSNHLAPSILDQSGDSDPNNVAYLITSDNTDNRALDSENVAYLITTTNNLASDDFVSGTLDHVDSNTSDNLASGTSDDRTSDSVDVDFLLTKNNLTSDDFTSNTSTSDNLASDTSDDRTSDSVDVDFLLTKNNLTSDDFTSNTSTSDNLASDTSDDRTSDSVDVDFLLTTNNLTSDDFTSNTSTSDNLASDTSDDRTSDSVDVDLLLTTNNLTSDDFTSNTSDNLALDTADNCTLDSEDFAFLLTKNNLTSDDFTSNTSDRLISHSTNVAPPQENVLSFAQL